MKRFDLKWILILFPCGLASYSQAASFRTPLNDTGLNKCYVGGAITNICSGTGQDAEFGRDVEYSRSKDGFLGFNFTKLSMDGKDLSNDAISWACVRDNVTGLVWENKTDDSGMHDYTNKYAIESFGPVKVSVAQDLVEESNNEAYCGVTDWRLPSRHELLSILNYGKYPNQYFTADYKYFKYTSPGLYWSADKYVAEERGNFSWAVSFLTADSSDTVASDSTLYVRVVSGGSNSGGKRFSKNDSEIIDKDTGLIWKRCSEGKAWTGHGCSGKAIKFSWQGAIDHAREVAAETGVAWRVPNVKELNSIVDITRVKPTIDEDAFPQTPNEYYRASTIFGMPERKAPLPFPQSSVGALLINFQKGHVLMLNIPDFDAPAALRLVRDVN